MNHELVRSLRAELDERYATAYAACLQLTRTTDPAARESVLAIIANLVEHTEKVRVRLRRELAKDNQVRLIEG